MSNTELHDQVRKILYKQLRNYWDEFDTRVIDKAIPKALELMKKGMMEPLHVSDNNEFENKWFFPFRSIHWMVFLYRLSHQIYIDGGDKTPIEADYVYYLNKIMHANDWFYAVDLPVHFSCEHPLGSVLGKAKYGDYLFVYQGTTVGGNRSNGVLSYPELGDNVILFANSSVLGDSHIGNNVVISSDTTIISQDVPDNCLVFGKSPNIVIKERSEKVIKDYTKHIWRWE